MLLKKYSWIVVVLCLFALPAWAASEFVISKIDIQGNDRVSNATVMHYLPIKSGDMFTSRDSSRIIARLYKTGLFKDIKVSHRGNTLIVNVIERATIGKISVTGNKSIEASKIQPVLDSVHMDLGDAYDPSTLSQFVQSLKAQYVLMGHYAVKITQDIEVLPRNRVSIAINIDEGPVAQVKHIRFQGNKAFSQSQLSKVFTMKERGLFSFITHNDRYSKEQFTKDLQALNTFYLDHGYLNFKVVSHDVKMSDDDKNVDLSIVVDEGAVYQISAFSITGAGADEKQVMDMIDLKAGDVFSRSHIIGVNKTIADYYAAKGYAFPDVQVKTQLDKAKHLVKVTFALSTGKRVYIRRVNITGNESNDDLFLRSRLRQLEGAQYSLQDVERSKRNLRMLSYINPDQISVKPVPVKGKPNQVDLDYHVTEVPAGSAKVNIGYNSLDGFLYGATISQPSFLGTGDQVSLGFTRSDYQSIYSLSVYDPNYTPTGIGRGYALSYNHTEPGDLYLATYTEDNYKFSTYYTIPITENNSVRLGGKYQYIRITDYDDAPTSIRDFLDEYPTPYNQFSLTGGWTYNSLDQAVFPDKGTHQSIDLELGVPMKVSSGDGSYSLLSLGYYNLSYSGEWYFPLGHGFILKPHTLLGYGDGMGFTDSLPFFNNYYGGGIGTLPGYENYALGPKYQTIDDDESISSSQYLGGNVQLFAGIDFILPNFISDSVRTAIILDAGNIYNTSLSNTTTDVSTTSGVESITLSSIRAVAGLQLTWKIPLLGAVTVAVATPIVQHSGDDVQLFNFTFGT